jgi:hypothetical protein
MKQPRVLAVLIVGMLALTVGLFPGFAASLGVTSSSLTTLASSETPTPPIGDPLATDMTAEMFDDAQDGFIDRVRVQFDEPIASDTDASDFTLTSPPSGRSITSVTISSNVATLALGGGQTGPSHADTAATDFRVSASVRAPSGTAEADLGPVAPADLAGPVLMSFTSTNAGTAGRFDPGDTLRLTFSESISPSSLPGAPSPSSTVRLIEPGGAPDRLDIAGVVNVFPLGGLNYLNQPGNSSGVARWEDSPVSLASGGSTVVVTIGPTCGNESGSGGTNAPCSQLLTASGTANISITPSASLKDLAENPAVQVQRTVNTRLF